MENTKQRGALRPALPTYIVVVIESKRLRLAMNVERTEREELHIGLRRRNSERQEIFGRRRRSRVDNIKMDLK